MLKAWSKLDVSHVLPIYYHNSNILGENGDTLSVYNCLAELKIKQVKELSFKRGKAGYNREVYMLSGTVHLKSGRGGWLDSSGLVVCEILWPPLIPVCFFLTPL